MTKYQEDIDDAQEMIEEFGLDFVIRRKADPDLVTTFSEADFGSLTVTAEGVITIRPGSLLAGRISVGDFLSFREISNFENRGPFEVLVITETLPVTDTEIEVEGSLIAGVDETWFMDVQKNPNTDTFDVGVQLPPTSVTGHSFDYAFSDGTLQISRAKDFILSAKDLSFRPLPGDFIQMGSDTWDEDAEAWTIFGVTPLEPDGTPIIWTGIMTKG